MERLMAKLLLRKFRRVLIDVNTQYDLIFQGNNDKSELLRNIRRLFAWARVNHIPVISTALIRRAMSCPEAFKNSKPFCLEGTAGQKKLRYSMLTANVTFGPDNRLDLPRHILSDYQQVIFEIRSDDPFSFFFFFLMTLSLCREPIGYSPNYGRINSLCSDQA